MVRPCKFRKVNFLPEITIFKPAGKHCNKLEYVELLIEELESIRLKDLLNLEQEECANLMNISRGTFQRILYSARKKIADALINGKAIKIQGGNFELINNTNYQCKRHRFGQSNNI